jgi:hypothetical protein
MMACLLNGTDQTLSISSTSVFGFSGNFTVANITRIDVANPPAYASYTSDFRSASQTSNFALGVINSSGTKMYGFGAGADAIGSTGLSLGVSYALAWRRSGTSVRMFVNGTDNGGFSTSHSQGNSPCVIGSRYTQITEFVNGAVAEFAVWSVALTDAEITALARGFTAEQIRPQSLSFYASLVRNFQDVRGGLAITNNNSATVAAHPRIIT